MGEWVMWQPIETAPKGERVLIAVTGRFPPVWEATYRDNTAVPFWDAYNTWFWESEVTHWMPLPEPPMECAGRIFETDGRVAENEGKNG